jgi:hypothetical protein
MFAEINVPMMLYLMVGLYLGGIDTHREYIKRDMPSFLCFGWGIVMVSLFWPIILTIYVFNQADANQRTQTK